MRFQLLLRNTSLEFLKEERAKKRSRSLKKLNSKNRDTQDSALIARIVKPVLIVLPIKLAGSAKSIASFSVPVSLA